MSANVRDIEAIRFFRAAMVSFAEDAESAYQSMMMESQRTLAWIEQDRPYYWDAQTRKAYDLIASTRSALETCRMRTVAGQRSTCIDEKRAVEAAKRRLQHCLEQKERVRSWAVKLGRQLDELRARLAGLRRMLDSDVPKAIALLENTATVLEAYADVQRESADPGSTSK